MIVFSVSGGLKSVLSKARMMETGQTGVGELSLRAIRVVGACELLAVVGLSAPEVLGRGLVLVPLAGSGLALVMVGAGVAHTRLREPRNVAVNVAIFAVCAFVAAGRLA